MCRTMILLVCPFFKVSRIAQASWREGERKRTPRNCSAVLAGWLVVTSTDVPFFRKLVLALQFG